MGDLAGSRAAFSTLGTEELFSNDVEAWDLAHFFKDTSRWLAADGIVETRHVEDLPSGSVRAIGLLAAGLKNWYEGDARAAAEFLRAFNSSVLPKTADWIDDCKVLAQPYLLDAMVIANLTVPDVSALTAAEADAALAKARESFAKITQSGSPRNKAAAVVEDFAVRVEQRKLLLTSRQEVNDVQRINDEIKLIRDSNNAAAPLGENFRFRDAAAKLTALELSTIEAITAREAHVDAWKKADDFLADLTKELALKPVESTVEHPGGAAVASVSASGNILIFHPVRGVEVKVPVNKLLPSKLVDLALLVRERTFDSDEFYKRTQLIYSFALRTGLKTTATDLAQFLASEFRPFRSQLELLDNREFATAP
jgi:hypothetical protein